MHWIVDTARHYLLAWGYGAIVVGLLGEDSGLPLPGETILLCASFLAYKGEHFELAWVILLGILSSTLGDNIGYLFGSKAGRKLIAHWRAALRISEGQLADGEALLRRHGPLAIFVARWIWGFRIMAGPLAGILKMSWKQFLAYNFLGAVSWVCTVATLGYLFGQFASFYDFFEKGDITLTLVIALVSLYWWHHYRLGLKKEKQRKPASPA